MDTEEDDLTRPSRQQLAIDRTHLANERTLLSYLRTSLGLIGFSILLLRFDNSKYARIYGIIIIICAVAIWIFGVYRFYHFRKRISSEKFFIESEK
jgi:putative membrane protein